MFAELQVRKSLGSPHTEEADPVHFRVLAGKMALAQGALPGGCAGDLSLPLERPPLHWPAPLHHLFCCGSVICHSLSRKRGWVHRRDCSQLHKLLDATKLISNQAGCGEWWEAARPGEGNAPCTGVDACSHGSSPRTLSHLPFPVTSTSEPSAGAQTVVGPSSGHIPDVFLWSP